MKINFIRKKEDFVCDFCGEKVLGSGYTNHCPKCLWSKHVDLKIPGDRLAKCKGLMRPIGVEARGGDYLIIHCCQKCGKVACNRASSKDDFEKIIETMELVAGPGIGPGL